MKRFLAGFQAASHSLLLPIWILTISALFSALFFALVGGMAPYDGLMWLTTLICFAWAIWASFPPQDE
ncbi:hypothetical protein NE579_00390 [Intestinimonas massiliensis]|uniref:Uncharacterized protein n=1 Tax=Intestinimonas massiliensis (ex Afouda et al. 2020) TaxID=1673721 RepID=A0AAW5JM04_9FIRM|nr:hypothetical protein [Intestinimonas massiliensis (ex Afouda et al. 2020)]MCQ4768924.1 hypothetical protein [Intestinimonas massiliensis (ex Afouda et al. 2020)]